MINPTELETNILPGTYMMIVSSQILWWSIVTLLTTNDICRCRHVRDHWHCWLTCPHSLRDCLTTTMLNAAYINHQLLFCRGDSDNDRRRTNCQGWWSSNVYYLSITISYQLHLNCHTPQLQNICIQNKSSVTFKINHQWSTKSVSVGELMLQWGSMSVKLWALLLQRHGQLNTQPPSSQQSSESWA